MANTWPVSEMSIHRYAAKVDANQTQVNAGGFGPHSDFKKMTAKRRSYLGEQNPNFRNAADRVCCQCGCKFQSYQKARKYCSRSCYGSAMSKPKMAKPEKPLKVKLPKPEPKPRIRGTRKVLLACAHCKAEFASYIKLDRKFCSYQCHLDSGGAKRAGDAAARAVMRYGTKKDANHNEVVDALRGAGCLVEDMSHVGCGFPDLMCADNGVLFLVEIKNPKTGYGRRGLNKRQKEWHKEWEGYPISIVDSAEAALRHLNVIRSGNGK